MYDEREDEFNEEIIQEETEEIIDSEEAVESDEITEENDIIPDDQSIIFQTEKDRFPIQRLPYLPMKGLLPQVKYLQGLCKTGTGVL